MRHGAVHRHRKKTAEVRLHTLARGWIAYHVTPSSWLCKNKRSPASLPGFNIAPPSLAEQCYLRSLLFGYLNYCVIVEFNNIHAFCKIGGWNCCLACECSLRNFLTCEVVNCYRCCIVALNNEVAVYNRHL